MKNKIKNSCLIDQFIFVFFFILAVMRLTKPTLFTNIPVTCEERDLPGKSFLLTDYYVCFTKFKQCDHLTLGGVMTSHRLLPETAIYLRFGCS